MRWKPGNERHPDDCEQDPEGQSDKRTVLPRTQH